MVNEIELRGVVVSGIGVAKKYVMMEPYKSFFRQILGCEPYPGTLNVKIHSQLSKSQFNRKDFRDVGSLFYLLGKIQHVDCIVLIPEKTSHQNIVELVSCNNLRKELNLMDGENVRIICRIQPLWL